MTFPSFAEAELLYISGQNYAIDNGGKDVTLFFGSYLQSTTGTLEGPIGDNYLSNGSSSFFPADNYMANGSGSYEVRDTRQVKMLCTVNSQQREQKAKSDETIGITFKKELNYIYSKFYMTEYNYVINAEYAIFNMPQSGIDQMKFKLASQPRDKNSIARGYYACCWWEQIQG